MKRAAILLLALSFNAKAMDAKLMVDIIECESSGVSTAVGDDAGTVGGVSVGIMQFQKATFAEMKIKAGHPEWRWKNPIHQMRLAVWMIEHGYARRWTCFRKLYKPMD